jgi:hypothetical protein
MDTMGVNAEQRHRDLVAILEEYDNGSDWECSCSVSILLAQMENYSLEMAYQLNSSLPNHSRCQEIYYHTTLTTTNHSILAPVLHQSSRRTRRFSTDERKS